MEKINNPSQKDLDGCVPDVNLCRFFQEQEHVDCFINGKYRFGKLKKYREKELGTRSDPTESEAVNYTSKGVMNGSLSSGDYYILCFTELNEDTNEQLLSKKFGKPEKPAVQVKIQDNHALMEKILKAWEKSNYKDRIVYFQWFKVEYSKFEGRGSSGNCSDLHIYQKPKQDEMYRFERIKKSPSHKVMCRSWW